MEAEPSALICLLAWRQLLYYAFILGAPRAQTQFSFAAAPEPLERENDWRPRRQSERIWPG